MRTHTLGLALVVGLLLGGCTTTQQQRTYQTLGSITWAVDGARKSYADAINLGQVSAAKQVQIDRLIVDYQLAMNTALDVAQFNLLAPAPDKVAALAAKVTTTIIVLINRQPPPLYLK